MKQQSVMSRYSSVRGEKTKFIENVYLQTVCVMNHSPRVCDGNLVLASVDSPSLKQNSSRTNDSTCEAVFHYSNHN